MISMTNELANNIISSSTRCTQATLRAFGIEGYPHYGSGCLEYLTQNGYKLQELQHHRGRKLRQASMFRKDLSFLISTKGHAMALINGILVDTERKGFDSRKIENIWIVEREG